MKVTVIFIFCFLFILFFYTGCSRPLDIDGLFLLDKYDGDNEVLSDAIGMLGILIEPNKIEEITDDSETAESDETQNEEAETEDRKVEEGYAFLPVIVVEGEVQLLPDSVLKNPPWRLVKSRKNRYEIYLSLFDENYYFDVKASNTTLEGEIIGSGERALVSFKKVQ